MTNPSDDRIRLFGQTLTPRGEVALATLAFLIFLAILATAGLVEKL